MNDNKKIESCIDLYYEGCCESDPVKIKQAFDENAMISGYLPDGLHEMNLDEFAGFVEAQQPSPKEKVLDGLSKPSEFPDVIPIY